MYNTINKYNFLIVILVPALLVSQSLRWSFISDGPGHQDDEVYKVIYASDGYIYSVGYQTASTTRGKDITVMKFSTSGTPQWSYRSAWADDDIGYDIIYGGNNLYIGGYATGQGKEYAILSLNTSGAERWSFISDGPAHQDDEVRAITYGGGYVYSAGYQTSSSSGKNICVMKFAASGSPQWAYRTYWTGDDIAYSIDYGSDGNIYVGGYASGQGREYVVLSLDPNTSIEEHSVQNPTVDYSLEGHPNPMINNIDVSLYCKNSIRINLKLYDISGKLIKTLLADRDISGCHKITWHGEDETGTCCAPGVYFCRLETLEFFKVLKITKLK